MDKLFISADSLLRDSMELARRVVSSGFRPTFLVAMWRGGAPIGIAIQEVLEFHSIRADHIAIRTSSYTGIDTQSKTVRVHAWIIWSRVFRPTMRFC
jgi:hypoxanthine phosphoribosyltransferase